MKLYTWVDKISRSRTLAGVGVLTIVLLGVGLVGTQTMAQNYYPNSGYDVNGLLQQIQSLQNRVASLETRVNMLEQNGNGLNSYPPPYYPQPIPQPIPQPQPQPYPQPMPRGAAVIDQNGGSYNGGWDIYFTGRGFAPNEQVLVTQNGLVVGHASADGAGGIRVSGILLPRGRQTFVFTGQQSGITAIASVTGQ